MAPQVSDYSIIVEKILSEVDVEKIILFGLRARGDDRPESDLNLLIIQKGEFNPDRTRWAEIIKIRKVLRDLKIPKDILLFSES